MIVNQLYNFICKAWNDDVGEQSDG